MRRIRTVVARALSRQGYNVQATSIASSLWRWIVAGEGDVVITDVGLPDENSLDLLPRIKQLRPDLPIIVMSARNTLLTAVRATERGAFEYLPKPFDITSLLATVQRSLERRSARAMRNAPGDRCTRSSCRSSAGHRRCRRSIGSSPGSPAPTSPC